MSLICFVIILPENFKRRLHQFEEKDLRVGRNLRIRIEELVVDFKENLFENNKISMMGGEEKSESV